MSRAQPLQMSEEEFRLLRDVINRHCGLYFQDHLKYLLERRLSERVTQRFMRSFKEYEQFLRYDPDREKEFSALIELLTTNETYFFRESYQLDAFFKEALPEIMARKSLEGARTLKVWSAGCSTGEEPYTLAMLMALEQRLASWQWEVFASDISLRSLQRAREGSYREHSFRAGIPREAEQFFVPHENGAMRVSDKIRRHVSFAALNLIDVDRLALVRKLDAVFCRNVLIYFDRETQRRVVEMFFEKLNPGGYLLLGHSESLINLTTKFELRHFENDMIYQRPLERKEGGR